MTHPASTPAPHQITTPDGELAVLFRWNGDRYAHVVQSGDGIMLASDEGTPEQDWPASPAIQQISTEMIDGQPTVLGVGCCGSSHFSVSVQVESDDENRQSIRFDWAARLSKPLSTADAGAWLGSTYAPAMSSSDKKPSTLVCRVEPIGDVIVTPDAPDKTESVQISPAQIAELRTVQWCYRIRFLNGDK